MTFSKSHFEVILNQIFKNHNIEFSTARIL